MGWRSRCFCFLMCLFFFTQCLFFSNIRRLIKAQTSSFHFLTGGIIPGGFASTGGCSSERGEGICTRLRQRCGSPLPVSATSLGGAPCPAQVWCNLHSSYDNKLVEMSIRKDQNFYFFLLVVFYLVSQQGVRILISEWLKLIGGALGGLILAYKITS